MLNVTGLGQFQNYFTGPYLAGTYAFQSFDPLLANPFLNPFLLTQDLLAGQARTGPVDQDLGRALFGVNNTNSRPNPPAGETAAPTGKDLIDQIIDRLLERTGSGGAANADAKPETSSRNSRRRGAAEEKKTAGSAGNSDLEALLKELQGSRSQGSGNPMLNSLMMNNPFFPGFNGGGLFANAPIQNATAGRLATLDPVIRNSMITETMSPINGLFLSSGIIPPFLINGLFANA